MNYWLKELLSGIITILFLGFAIFIAVETDFSQSSSSNGFFVGEAVNIKSGQEYSIFYNKECKKRTIKGLQAIDDVNLAWVLLESCTWTNSRLYMVTFDQKELEKAE